MAEKAVKEAHLGLDKTVVRAPAAGIILERQVYLGQMVGPQQTTPLFKIASDLGQLELHAQVGEGDVSRVQSGQDVVFTVNAYAEGNVRFEGKVKQVRYLPNSVQGAVFFNTVVQVANRQVPPSRETWMQVGNLFAAAGPCPTLTVPPLYQRPEETWMLRPGMTASVDIVRRRHANVWKVPVEALNLQLDEHYQNAAARAKLEEWKKQHSDHADWNPVWVLQEGKNHQKPWPIFVRVNGLTSTGEPGIKDNQFIEVLDWDPEVKGKMNPNDESTLPKVIISAPPVSKPGLLEKPTRIMS
jgi:hypothetical protein